MDFEKLNGQIHIYLTIALAFSIPSFPFFLSPLIGLLVLNWLIFPKRIVPGIKTAIKNPAFSFLMLLYVFYLVGMLYSSNIKFGLEVIETKLSFVLLPFIYSSYYKITLDNLSRYMKGFLFGCVAYAVGCLGWAAYAFFKPVYTELYGVMNNLGSDYFYYTYLSVFFHPSYSSLYVVTALIFIVYLTELKLIKVNLILGVIIALLVVFVLLLSSKAGWISLLLVTVYGLSILIRKNKILVALMILSFLFGLFFFLNINHTSSVMRRIPKMEDIEKVVKDNEVTTSSDASATRVLLWKASFEIIHENLLTGVGTGDTKDAMLRKYTEKKMFNEHKHGLNAHNQFLNTGVALGVFGIILLIASLAVPFYYSIKRRQFYIYLFITVVGINLLFESMFETQAGVIFYMFIASLLYLQYSKVGMTEEIQN